MPNCGTEVIVCVEVYLCCTQSILPPGGEECTVKSAFTCEIYTQMHGENLGSAEGVEKHGVNI